MHILLLNQYYPPDTSATAKMAVQIAEKLAQRHRVTVVAGRPSYDPDEYYPYSLQRKDVRNNVTVERVGSTAYPRHQMRRRVSNYLSYLALAVPRALAIRPDIVLAMTDPPVAGIAGAFVARMSSRPFVYNIRDLYPDMAVGGEIVNSGFWVDRWEKMHRRALRQAARVVVLGDDMRDRIIAKGVAPERVVIVRDGTSFPSSLPERSDPAGAENSLRLFVRGGTCGQFGILRSMEYAAESCRNFAQRKYRAGVCRRRGKPRDAGSFRAIFAKCTFLAVFPGRASAARNDGGRRSHRDGPARPGGRCSTEQALFDSRGWPAGTCGGPGLHGRCPHRHRNRLRHVRGSRRSSRRSRRIDPVAK